jgi:SAM-dependent methyltransferase
MTRGKASYDSLYRGFDSPVMRRLRLEAYGEDIGQHSWVDAEELRTDIPRLGLARASRLLDLGCGPGGPLTFVLRATGCRGTGIDVSAAALETARERAASLGIEPPPELHAADLNETTPFADGSFDAAIALDVILHLRDRAAVFREVARILAPGGRFLFTDAAVLVGSVSDEEIRLRSVHGYTRFSAPGYNERMLELAGFRLLQSEDRTASLLRNATGRLRARLAHRAELEQLEGDGAFERQCRYLETVIELSRRGAVSRTMYLSEPASEPRGLK